MRHGVPVLPENGLNCRPGKSRGFESRFAKPPIPAILGQYGKPLAKIPEVSDQPSSRTMRSQKQTNKAPRPHKSQSAARGFSGGHTGFIPPPKFPVKTKQQAAASVSPAPDKTGEAGPASDTPE